MKTVNSSSSMLDLLRAGMPIDVNAGSFGKPGGGNLSIVSDHFFDMQSLTSGLTKYTYFDGVRSTSPNLTNCTAQVVPGGERYDLYGLDAYWLPAAALGTLTEVELGLVRQFIRNASLEVRLSQVVIVSEPLASFFGNQAFNAGYATPTLAVSGPSNSQTWKKRWPDELFFTLQSTVQMTFTVNLSGYTTAAGLAGMYLGFAFPRIKAAKV